MCLLLTSCISGASTLVIEEGAPIEVHFCPCRDVFEEFVNGKVDCALYDTDSVDLRDDSLVLDKDHKIKHSDVIYDTRKAYMHHKFCVSESTLMGSANPTKRGLDINYNHLIKIPSKHITALYQKEFDELRKGKFGKGSKKHTSIVYNGRHLEVLFCPEDKCKETVMKYLSEAKERIWFMTFSFTDKDIAKLLIEKKKLGLDVKGIIEGQRKTMKYNNYKRLKDHMEIALENTGATFHHKVFIVDNYVITGSANPTSSGYSRNDENILILNHPHIVKAFEKEFIALFNDFMSA